MTVSKQINAILEKIDHNGDLSQEDMALLFSLSDAEREAILDEADMSLETQTALLGDTYSDDSNIMSETASAETDSIPEIEITSGDEVNQNNEAQYENTAIINQPVSILQTELDPIDPVNVTSNHSQNEHSESLLEETVLDYQSHTNESSLMATRNDNAARDYLRQQTNEDAVDNDVVNTGAETPPSEEGTGQDIISDDVDDPINDSDLDPSLTQTEFATSITHESSGVTYHFAEPVEVGKYWNGDVFVVNNGQDIVITQITPESADIDFNSGTRTVNGTVVQPGEHLQSIQGFDSVSQSAIKLPYDETLNEDPGATGEALTISVSGYPDGASIVKAVSNSNDVMNDGAVSSVSEYSVLTVVSEVPPENAFRPPVEGADKTSYYTTDDLDFSKLQNVDLVEGQKEISDFDLYTNATYNSWNGSADSTRTLDPLKYHESYGDYQMDKMVDAFMALHTNATDVEKLDLYASLVQTGIDYSGALAEGQVWTTDGGHNAEIKPFVVLAGVALDSDAIKATADSSTGQLQEDVTYLYVTEEHTENTPWSDIGGRNQNEAYQEASIGMPEWMIRGDLRTDMQSSLISRLYRTINADNVPSIALVMEMLGDGEGAEVWDNQAYFDYADRVMNWYEQSDLLHSGEHRIETAWGNFLYAYHDKYKTTDDWVGVPEHGYPPALTASGSGIHVELSDIEISNSGEILQRDLRYSTDGENWTVLTDVANELVLSGLDENALYYVQVRLVNDMGPGAWSTNQSSLNIDTLWNQLDAMGIDVGSSDNSSLYKDVYFELLDGVSDPDLAQFVSDNFNGAIVTGSGETLASGKPEISDDTVEGTIIASLVAIDSDGNELTYTLTENANDLIRLEGFNIAANSDISYEDTQNVSIDVVRDNGFTKETVTYNFDVIDVNEGITDVSVELYDIYADMPVGTIVGKVSATDGDGDVLNMRFHNADAGLNDYFEIVDGDILVKAPLTDIEGESFGTRVYINDGRGSNHWTGRDTNFVVQDAQDNPTDYSDTPSYDEKDLQLVLSYGQSLSTAYVTDPISNDTPYAGTVLGIDSDNNVVDMDASTDSSSGERPIVSALNRIAANFEEDGETSPTLLGDSVGSGGRSLVELYLGSDDRYDDAASGLAATEIGGFFYVENEDGNFDIYINDGATGGITKTTGTEPTYFDNIINSLTVMKDYADSGDYDLQTDLIFSWIQGQADSKDYVAFQDDVDGDGRIDSVDTYSYVITYSEALEMLVNKIDNTADNILEEDINIISVIGQQAYGYPSKQQISYIAETDDTYLGALEMTYQRENAAGIDYETGEATGTDTTHLNALGYNLLGQDTGDIIYEIMTGQKEEDEFMYMEQVLVNGTEVIVKFANVQGSLVVDTTQHDGELYSVTDSLASSLGFSTGGLSSVTVDNAVITGDNEVTITLTNEIPTYVALSLTLSANNLLRDDGADDDVDNLFGIDQLENETLVDFVPAQSLSFDSKGLISTIFESDIASTRNDVLGDDDTDDVLVGTSDSDKLVGYDGDDTLYAGDGYDALFGQDGADTFIITDNENYDMIRDFNTSEGDVIDISALLTDFNDVDDAIADFVELNVYDDGLSAELLINKDGVGDDFELAVSIVSELSIESIDQMVIDTSLIV